jgi:hypothetical protein
VALLFLQKAQKGPVNLHAVVAIGRVDAVVEVIVDGTKLGT